MRFSIIAALFFIPAFCFGQNSDTSVVKPTAAYAELLVRKTELRADLEAVVQDYTESNPKILDLRFEIASLERSLVRVLATKATESGKLTIAVGKLLVKKAALETDHARLLRSYNTANPEVKRAKRRVEIFDQAINEIIK